jgi:hypothetical protein
MFEAENIRDWREHDVVDPDGKKIGLLESVYVDTGTDEPAFGSIRIGMIGRHRLTFVPLDRAVVLPGQLKVAYSKSQVKGAPTIDTDGELPATDEEELFKHYGLDYQPGLSGERRLARRLSVSGGSHGGISAPRPDRGRARHRRRGGQGPAVPAVHRHRGLHRVVRGAWRLISAAPTAADPVAAAAGTSRSSARALSEPGAA